MASIVDMPASGFDGIRHASRSMHWAYVRVVWCKSLRGMA